MVVLSMKIESLKSNKAKNLKDYRNKYVGKDQENKIDPINDLNFKKLMGCGG